MTDSTDSDRRRRRTWLLLVAAAMVGALLLAVAPHPSAAANTATPTPTPTPSLDEKAPFYDDNTTAVDNRSWTHGHRDTTLANVSHYLTRVGGFIIGDEKAQGGGWAGPMVLGIIFVGAVLSAGSGVAIGPVAGVTVATETAAGLVAVSLAPVWTYPVIIFVLGGTVYMTVFRSFT